MTTALIYLVVMVVVAAVVFLLASVVFGRGEQLAPLPPGSTPTRLPADDIAAADVHNVRFQQVLRGYKMAEVDWVLARLAGEIETLRDRVAELESAPAGPDAPPAHPADSGQVTEHEHWPADVRPEPTSNGGWTAEPRPPADHHAADHQPDEARPDDRP